MARALSQGWMLMAFEKLLGEAYRKVSSKLSGRNGSLL